MSTLWGRDEVRIETRHRQWLFCAYNCMALLNLPAIVPSLHKRGNIGNMRRKEKKRGFIWPFQRECVILHCLREGISEIPDWGMV